MPNSVILNACNWRGEWRRINMSINNGVEEISKKQFETRINSKFVAVDFWASWCMPCIIMSPVIEEMSDKFRGKIEFVKINIDDNSYLASKFKVMSVPTLIIFKEGKELQRIVGNVPAENLEERLRKILR